MKRRKFLWITAATSLVILFPVYSCNSDQKLNKSAANPTFTLVALSLRLSDHIKLISKNT